jgi:glycosyltransferase 2 family protein
MALWAITIAPGEPVRLPELLFIRITVSLFAGIVPIPGGIGVVETALIFGLARAGMTESAAFAAAIMYRFATFYLPPIWGFLALRRLGRNKHL